MSTRVRLRHLRSHRRNQASRRAASCAAATKVDLAYTEAVAVEVAPAS